MSSKKSETYTFTGVAVGIYPLRRSVTGDVIASSRQEAITKVEAGIRARGLEPYDLTVRKA
ncbi:hypothetical protein [Streptomyces decoyicus]|uniref:hypothetical protein n=1 Tax=Streptomyces decoyicus TaxID=249567 RepID=UPI00386DCBE9|nr:hypothetical protein OG532_26080 [Streptomyces decoyicus]